MLRSNLLASDLLQKRFGPAEQTVKQLERALEPKPTPESLDMVSAAFNTAAYYYYTDRKPEKVLEYSKKGLDIQLRFLFNQLPYLDGDTEQAALLKIVESQGYAAEWIYWWATKTELAHRDSLEVRLNLHGIQQDIQRQKALLVSASPQLKKIGAEVRDISARLMTKDLPEEDKQRLSFQYLNLRDSLKRSAIDLHLEPATVPSVAAAMPSNSVLVEFQKYREFISDYAGPGKEWGKSQYLAFVLTPRQKIMVVRLGESRRIDEAIQAALLATSQNQADSESKWKSVADVVILPLLPLIDNSKTVFIAPDAELNRIPFQIFSHGLGEGSSHYARFSPLVITSGRDLLRLKSSAPNPTQPIVIAAPTFGASPDSNELNNDRQRNAVVPGSDRASPRWLDLPGTVEEGRLVSTYLNAKLISGVDANESVVASVKGPKVLHIASHGYFASSQASLPLRYLSPRVVGDTTDPQLSSGIVLAGANRGGSDPRMDGLLTAREVTGLDLAGTELVVLSACSTGQGEIRSGEGVYGLERALTVAGARSTLLSLWDVDDAATAAFMERYYKRLKAGEGRADALTAVQREFREGTAGNGKWKEPFYWAAWQLVGDWRPIQGL